METHAVVTEPSFEKKPTKVASQSSKLKLPIGIVFFIIVITLVGERWYYFASKSSEKNTPLQQRASILPTAQMDNSNWKTYTNNTLHFSFKYPPSYTPVETAETLANVTVGILLVSPLRSINRSELALCKEDINEQPCLIPGKNWGQNHDFEPMLLGNKRAVNFYMYMGKAPNFILEIVQTEEDPPLELAFAVDGAGLKQTFDRILSTFQFIDQQNLIYVNNQVGFSLTLPQTWQGYQTTQHTYKDYSDVCFYFSQTSPICVLQLVMRTQAQMKSVTDEQQILNSSADPIVVIADYSPNCIQHDEFQCARSKEIPAILQTYSATP